MMLCASSLVLAESSGLSDYPVGSGDLLSIQVFGEADLSAELRLSDAGTLSYPFLGELRVQGLTIGQLSELIRSRLADGYLVNPNVNVTVLEYRKFYINGEIKSPGAYFYQPGLTLERAVTLAGGFTDNASESKVYVIHDGEEGEPLTKLNLGSLILPGDSVTVWEYQKFYINGEVKSPGAYAYKIGMTLQRAVVLAGGFTDNASKDKMYVIHDGEETQPPQKLNMGSVIIQGDVVTVQEYQQFYINGEVKSPGAYDYQKGLTLQKAVTLAGGFTERASKSKMYVIHDGEEDKPKQKLDLSSFVLPGDVISIDQSFF
jgi:polysaccharide export outer membrane protein